MKWPSTAIFPNRRRFAWKRPESMLDTKLQAILAYASQEQIGALVEIQRASGPVEYLRELKFRFYAPKQYNELFARTA